MCPYCLMWGRQAGGRPWRQRATVAKIPHTRRVRTSLAIRVDARLTTGGVPEKLRCSQSMSRPAKPYTEGFDAGCAILSAQYDGLLARGPTNMRRAAPLTIGASELWTARGVYCKDHYRNSALH